MMINKECSRSNKQEGFTLIETGILLLIISIILISVFTSISNGGKETENRAKNNMWKFVNDNGLQAKRMSCAADSDGDGFSSCTVVTLDGEKIRLQCPSSWTAEFRGITVCKEVDFQQKLRFGHGGWY